MVTVFSLEAHGYTEEHDACGSFLRREDPQEGAELLWLRSQGDLQLCSLRKENLTSWTDPETDAARHIFRFEGSEVTGEWHPIAELPFLADKSFFTTVVLYNYLFFIGGYRQRLKRGWEFKMASFRYNPFTNTWVSTAPLIKVGFSHLPPGNLIFLPLL